MNVEEMAAAEEARSVAVRLRRNCGTPPECHAAALELVARAYDEIAAVAERRAKELER